MAFTRTIPSLPARDVARSAAYYAEALGFSIAYAEKDFARLVRDEIEIHLWGASDTSWPERADFVERPVCSGAEDFIAGTASCRIGVDSIDDVYAEVAPTALLHPTDEGSPVTTPWQTKEFNVVDPDGNLLTFYEHTG